MFGMAKYYNSYSWTLTGHKSQGQDHKVKLTTKTKVSSESRGIDYKAAAIKATFIAKPEKLP